MLDTVTAQVLWTLFLGLALIVATGLAFVALGLLGAHYQAKDARQRAEYLGGRQEALPSGIYDEDGRHEPLSLPSVEEQRAQTAAMNARIRARRQA